MNRLVALYRKSSWHDVFNFSDEAGSARSNVLIAGLFNSMISALAEGTFYTGYLLCYGINIVNISILTAIPYITGFFSLLTPRILAPFKKRRVILSVSRILYFVIRILGVTLLPQIAQSEAGRTWGLVAIVFISSSINNLFTTGYSAWHMSYLTKPEIRVPYLAAYRIVIAVAGQVFPLFFSGWIDALEGQAKLDAFTLLRFCALGAVALDVYFHQRPKEPEYKETSAHHSLMDVLCVPLKNSRFRWTMVIYFGYIFGNYIAYPMENAWALDILQSGLQYVSVVNAMYIPILLLTRGLWSKVARRLGNYKLLTVALGLYLVNSMMFIFTNKDNYLWMFGGGRLFEHALSMAFMFSAESLIYVVLPDEDRTCYLSFYTILTNVATFAGTMLGAWVVSLVGDGAMNIWGYSFGAIPCAWILQSIIMVIVIVLNITLRKKVESKERSPSH